MEIKVKDLDKGLIERANSVSFNGNRGDLRENSYKTYVEMMCNWKISDVKKQKLLDKLYDKSMEILRYEAQHVSVMVAGPAKYNPKKFDKSDKILELGHNFCIWLEELESQIKESEGDTNIDETKKLLEDIKRIYEINLNPTNDIMKLAYINNSVFIKTYEKYV